MPSSSTDPAEFLGDLLLRLVEVLRRRRGFTWHLLIQVTAGRTGYIELDGHRLALQANDESPYRLAIEKSNGTFDPHFRSTGAAIVDILRGRTTLDQALDHGRVFVRAPLSDLLSIYLLVMNILADSPINAELRCLCQEWESGWPHLPLPTELPPLEEQSSRYGQLVSEIPLSIQIMEGFVSNGDST